MVVLGLFALLVIIGLPTWFFTRERCELCGKLAKTHRYRRGSTYSLKWCDTCAGTAHPTWVKIDGN